MDYYKIGQKIRQYRKALNLSQEQLAEQAGISLTHMSHIETGNTKLSLQVLVDIAKTLNIYFVYLPPYSPEFAPIEGVFKIIKYELRSNILKTKEEVMNKCVKVYYEKCVNSSLWLWFVERYLTIIS